MIRADPNNSRRLGGRVVKLLKHVLPRSRSKIAFLLVVTCYQIVFNRITTDIVGLGYYSKGLAGSLDAGLPPMRQINLMLFTGGLLIGPVFESAILIAAIEGLRKLHGNVAIQVFASVSLLCVMHSIPYFLWGLLVAPQFFIDAGTYFYWRRRSFWTGALMMIGVHALYNAFAVLHTMAYRASP